MPKDVTTNSGMLGLGAVCMRTMDRFDTIGCSSWDGRTIKVNGTLVTDCVGKAMCTSKGPFGAPIGGYSYFEVSAGDHDYAAFNWYSTM